MPVTCLHTDLSAQLSIILSADLRTGLNPPTCPYTFLPNFHRLLHLIFHRPVRRHACPPFKRLFDRVFDGEFSTEFVDRVAHRHFGRRAHPLMFFRMVFRPIVFYFPTDLPAVFPIDLTTIIRPIYRGIFRPIIFPTDLQTGFPTDFPTDLLTNFPTVVPTDGRRKQIKNAKNAYVKALEYNKNHAKALQQLGWLHYKDEDDFRSAIEYLKRASEIGQGMRWVHNAGGTVGLDNTWCTVDVAHLQ